MGGSIDVYTDWDVDQDGDPEFGGKIDLEPVLKVEFGVNLEVPDFDS
ncbi:MAG: hypothetical protein F6K14_08640 [Symploca sp. SIO2C1]|nr:hypothetical protein [Symploca sp. SIO2C1]